MAEFDAELYLRLTGERALLNHGSDDGQPGETQLGAAAHALVAVGAMTAGAAQAIVDDYDLALAYRAGEHHRRHHRRRTRQVTPAPTLGRLRAARCLRLIEQPWGQLFLSYVVLGDKVTVLHVTMHPALASPGEHQLRSRRVLPGGGRRHPAGGRVLGPGCPGSSP